MSAGGVCGLGMCNAGFADCDNNAGNGCEVNTNTDKNNCGGCGKVCMNGNSCSNGACLSVAVGTVCGKVNMSGILCGGNCTFNHAQYADAYCVLAGYTKAVSYTVLNMNSVNCLYYNSNGNANGNALSRRISLVRRISATSRPTPWPARNRTTGSSAAGAS